MVKLKTLQKRLIKIATIVVVVLALTGAGTAGVYSWSASIDKEKKDVERKLSTAKRDISSSEKAVKEAEEYLELYRELKGETDEVKLASLDREVGMTLIQKVGNKLGLTDLTGSVSPIQKIANEDYQKETMEGIVSKISLKFNAMTDEQVIQFVETIIQYFPGFVKVERLDIKRGGEITDDVLRRVSNGQKPNLVQASMDFQWIGVRAVNKGEGEAK